MSLLSFLFGGDDRAGNHAFNENTADAKRNAAFVKAKARAAMREREKAQARAKQQRHQRNNRREY